MGLLSSSLNPFVAERLYNDHFIVIIGSSTSPKFNLEVELGLISGRKPLCLHANLVNIKIYEEIEVPTEI